MSHFPFPTSSEFPRYPLPISIFANLRAQSPSRYSRNRDASALPRRPCVDHVPLSVRPLGGHRFFNRAGRVHHASFATRWTGSIRAELSILKANIWSSGFPKLTRERVPDKSPGMREASEPPRPPNWAWASIPRKHQRPSSHPPVDRLFKNPPRPSGRTCLIPALIHTPRIAKRQWKIPLNLALAAAMAHKPLRFREFSWDGSARIIAVVVRVPPERPQVFCNPLESKGNRYVERCEVELRSEAARRSFNRERP